MVKISECDVSYLSMAKNYFLAREFHASLAICALVLIRSPGNVIALRLLCKIRCLEGDYNEALKVANNLEQLGFDVAEELSKIAIGLMHQCDWYSLEDVQRRLARRLTTGVACIVDTYSVMAFSDDPGLHLSMAMCIAASIRSRVKSLHRKQYSHVLSRVGDERYRVGYLCGYLNNHPMSILMAGIFERHDRRNFEIFIYDNSVEDGSLLRARVKAAADRFILLGSDGPISCADRIVADRIDILIDLNGYTHRGRSEVLALRPAPIQASFLGYVGTQGAEWIDYVLADEHVLPFSDQVFWREEVIHLPGCYLPNDDSRPLIRQTPTNGRKAFGLPQTGVVFASFNSCHKITKEMFDLWTDLLHAVDGSVLWLHKSNGQMAENLSCSASAMGIDSSRLIFADPMPFADHIQRHCHADIFLDTFPYGAHTTGADALWAGVPLVTMLGNTFSSRVGASMLVSIGMRELICETRKHYFETAKKLALDEVYRAGIKRRLAAAREASLLFDAAQHAAALENAYLRMVADYYVQEENI
jgi:protein O-GlcNAc transferase